MFVGEKDNVTVKVKENIQNKEKKRWDLKNT